MPSSTREGWLGKIEKQGRSGTSNIGVIHGGEATNVVTPLVELRAEARSHDPAFRQKVISAIEAAFSTRRPFGRRVPRASAAAWRSKGNSTTRHSGLPDDDPSLLAAEEAIRGLGGEPFRAISNGGLDANWLTARGIPTVSLGCGQTSPHTTAERLDRAEFHRACRLALRLAMG